MIEFVNTTLDRIQQLNLEDIKRGNYSDWRWEQYDKQISQHYTKILLLVWKPLDKFITDPKFLE